MRKIINNKQSLFLAGMFFVGLALGFSDNLYSNYFLEVYNADSVIRGFMELPREAPGVIGIFIIASLSFMGDIKLAAIAQILSAIGLTILGFITPSFGIMCILIFITSVGLHIFLPLQDSVALLVCGKDDVGAGIAKAASMRLVSLMIGSIIIIIGFRVGFFSFDGIILPFIIAGISFVIAGIIFFILYLKCKEINKPSKKPKLSFSKKYTRYYILCILSGVQKQIMFVFGPWVLVDLLSKQADDLSLLIVISSFIGIFFVRLIGLGIDKLGIRKLLFCDAWSFVFVYLAYAGLTFGFDTGLLATSGVAVILTMALFVLDRMSMQFSIVRSVYLRQIIADPSDFATTIATGMSLDHIVSVISAFVGGVVWSTLGPHYVFIFVAILSFGNVFIAKSVKKSVVEKTV